MGDPSCELCGSSMGANKMKQRYLAVYDYGMGGLWGYVLASSPREITDKYPEVTVVGDEPPWMTDERRAKLEVVDIHDPIPKGILANVELDRTNPGYVPPSGKPERRHIEHD